MKKSLILIIAVMMPLFLFGQSYSSLWKKVAEAEEKDLPKTAYDVLQQIVKKAEKGRDYGQLLKAELQSAQAMAEIAPDSLRPALDRIRQRSEEAQDDVLKVIYQTVLYRICQDNSALQMTVDKPELTPALCGQLARVKDKDYAPFVVRGVDAGVFDNDLLSVVGYELEEYEALHDYYVKAGNRRAACITAAQVYRYASAEEIDSLFETYGDLPEAGEIAIEHYWNVGGYDDDRTARRYNYIQDVLARWGSWPRMNELRNKEAEMTNPQYDVSYDQPVVLPQQSQAVKLERLRNLSSLSMKVWRVNANGDIDESPMYDKGYQRIKPLLSDIVIDEQHTYVGKQPYEIFEDSITLKGLPVGVYMVEFQTVPSTSVIRRLYYVTDVYTIAQGLPAGEGVRYVVVSATTGQPIPGAHLRIEERVSYNEKETSYGETDAKGEYIFKTKGISRNRRVFAYTDSDKACPCLDGSNRYDYYRPSSLVRRTEIYTDRAIYRPGQTVHASALLYQVKKGIHQSVSQQEDVTFRLYDANRKMVEEKTALTDEYGVCAVDFTLPSSGLTGLFSIQVDDERQTFRVEEYKRPTFHVDFPEVKEAYAAGDTLTVKGTAMSYAGVPVQGAKVSYKVVRRTAFWWWSYSRYWDSSTLGYSTGGDEIFNSTAVTDEDGHFDVTLPLTLPETSYPMFYNFVVTADVTDTAGETHSGQLSLPLGNRKQALSVDMKDKVLVEEQPKVTFHLLNAAGKDIDAEVQYRIDGAEWQKAGTHQSVALSDKLKSGKHTLEAVCEGDTITRDFVLFSLDDQQPATETDDWFYQSAEQFPGDGKPVTIQVGSSDSDVHIVYSVFAGAQIIEQGAVDRTNRLFNLKITYEEAYGDGLQLTFAWVKNGKCYTHSAQIKRPLPDKRLRLEWSTFRDRLQPGQQEEWTLTVKDADGNPVDAQLMATLYDKSLDQLAKHEWSLSPYLWLSIPSASWSYATYYGIHASGSLSRNNLTVQDLQFSTFDKSVYPSYYYRSFHRFGRGAVLKSFDAGAVMYEAAAVPEPMMMKERKALQEVAVMDNNTTAEAEEDNGFDAGGEEVQVRENLNETAFFYPQLTTDKDGCVALKFTLPESLTTWRFLGLAHTKDMYYGGIEGETVAQKDVMIQPNVPRFLREGDQGVIAARIFNTSEKDLSGKASLKLIDPETDAVVWQQSQPVSLKAGSTTSASFDLNSSLFTLHSSLLICQMTVSGKGFSDGEQQYLPILPSSERVTVTRPITQHHAGTETIDLAAMIPADAKDGKLTFEYTNDPAWLMIQALPALGTVSDENAISQAASYYANALGKYILDQNPQAKTAFALWKQDGTSLESTLEKNQELKELVLNETPWVLDADREAEQKQRLADFFDENLMQNRLSSTIAKLNKLQLGNGAWTWWKDMPGSFYMTVAVSEMLVRLNAMAGPQQRTEAMLSSAFGFMGSEIVEEVNEMKKQEKKGLHVSFPSFKALEWLYLATLDGRELPSEVQAANNYLLKLLKKGIKNQSIYEKALTAVILSKSDPKRAAEYVQSLKEYTVFTEEMGRYYDTPRAGYSWYDYKIPTQTVAIEALSRLAPDDRQTIEEMQRWLLQEKRTQAWDTPINSVNAVYAFLSGNSLRLSKANATVKVDNKPLDMPKETAAVGYVKTSVPASSRQLAVEKTTEGTSWGAVYAQFFQQTKNIADSGSGLTIKREILTSLHSPLSSLQSPLTVGDRIRVRITITADRDYDFVQVVDKRAACMEPVRQLSGWHSGSYCAPKDNSTNYYFDMLSKGEHVIENEYFIDRAGTYETGTCTVQCAYSPEFHAVTKSETLKVKE